MKPILRLENLSVETSHAVIVISWENIFENEHGKNMKKGKIIISITELQY